jgi:hypothetical protein
LGSYGTAGRAFPSGYSTEAFASQVATDASDISFLQFLQIPITPPCVRCPRETILSQNEDLVSSNIGGECISPKDEKKMGIANYTNLSELMNDMLKTGLGVSISELTKEAGKKKVILASEGELADKSDCENAFIALVDALYRAGAIKPDPENETEFYLVRLYESGKLAEKGYGGDEGDQFLDIKWKALTDNLPVITNLNL